MDRARSLAAGISEEGFLAWAEIQEERYELVEGQAMMQAGATRDHERVAKRVFALLYAGVDEHVFDVNKGDFGVRIRPGSGQGTILYPDVVVDRQSARGDEQATETPLIVIEVLSKGTDFAHHVRKLERYKRRTTLEQYVVLDQKQPRAWIWQRNAGQWPAEPECVEGHEATLAFPSVGASLSLAAIYRPPLPTTA